MSPESTSNTYDSLRDRLISSEFEPGQRLRSDVLRDDYGVSASNIRELLFRLSTVGLVEFLEQRGFRMPIQSAEVLDDLARTRILLECEGACLSIRYGSVAWEARLIAAHHELKHIETHIGSMQNIIKRSDTGFDELYGLWAKAELNFHRTLIERSQSNILKEYHLQVYYRFRQQLISTDRDFVYIPTNVDQHQGILEAVLERDEVMVKRCIHDHLARHLTISSMD